MPPKKKGGKKGGDDWDDDAAEKKLAALSIGANKETAFSDDEEEIPQPKKKTAKSKPKANAFLMMDDDEASEKSEKSDRSDDEGKEEPEPEPAKKEAATKDKKKKQNKGKKGKTAEDEDLDALLENLDKPLEKEAKGKKKGKKEKVDDAAEAEAPALPTAAAEPVKESTPSEPKDETPAPEEHAEAEGGDDEKKKDKKKKKKKKGDKGKEEAAEEDEKVKEDAGEGDEGHEGGEGKKKKKKDKEKEGGKKKQVSLIKQMLRAREEAEQEAARKAKEEEERLAELERKREEEEKIAREKKELEKQRKKEREEQLKREGKFLTAKQKQQQAQQQARLAAMGIDVNKIKEEAKKKVVYEDKRKKKQQEQKTTGAAVPSKETTPTEPQAPEPVKPVEEADEWEKAEVEEAAPIVDDWEKADAEDWDRAAEAIAPEESPREEKQEVEKKIEKVPAAAAKKASVDEEEEEEESSEEESSDEDEESSDEDEESSDEESEDEVRKETKEEKLERVRQRLKKRAEAAYAARDLNVLRAPVICVLGHVDTGKTKMLDTIRRTNVQDGEAGGITQQIGATQVPGEAIIERCKQVRDFDGPNMKIPGFLIIDTPGHESFANLRSRGSSLCDFAILVVDIMHGLEPQTIESLKLLLKRGTPFVVALNKIDRLHGYESSPRKDIYQHLKSQSNNVQLEFKDRYNMIVGQFAEQGINVCLSNDKKKNSDEYVHMVPTSAVCGDGIGNIMAYIATTVQTRYAQKLAFSEELDCTVMEVKAIPGLGTTIDAILVNGWLRVGDIIVLTGADGAIMTQVRELLMPKPLRELRVKNEYDHFKEIKAAHGVKILAKGLEKCLAGLPLFVAHKEDEIDVLKAESEAGLAKALHAIKRKPEGVYVQASTLGSLEALLEFLKSQKIPYANVNIGPVHKKDVQKAAVMLEHKEEYACILAFDVKVEKDAQQFADREGVRIFQADIIYHLEDNFLAYREELRQKYRRQNEHLAIFPCRLRVLPQHVFNARNPIVVGVTIEAGQLKRGTPICVPSKECIFLGNVASIERNHEEVNLAKAGEDVCIKIENTTGEAPRLYGRHFTHEDPLVSRLSRESIDACKAYFREDLTKADWQLVVELKRLLDIM